MYLILALVLGILPVSLYPASVRASEPGSAELTGCVVMPGWWLSPNGTRMFQVVPNARSVDLTSLPWGACSRTPLSGLYVSGPPCDAELSIACTARVEIVFISSVSAILSAERIGPVGACTDTCMAWNALPVHPESVSITDSPWSFVKRLFR